MVARVRRAAWLGFTLVLAVIALAPASAGAEAAGEEAGEEAGECGRNGLKATLELEPDEEALLDFGRSRGPNSQEVALLAKGCEFRPNQHVRPTHRSFRRGSASIPKEHVTLSAVTEREALLVTVHVDPSGISPGEYVGRIVVDDPRVNPFAFDFTTKAQYENYWLLFGWMLLVLVFGTFLVWAGTDKPMLPNGFRSMAVYFIAIGAAGSAFYATYWNNPTWGVQSWQFITLAGVVLSAYIAAITASRSVGAARTAHAAGNEAEDPPAVSGAPPGT